jgi:alpha-tubulin suppressor-like RCC1 family protein
MHNTIDGEVASHMRFIISLSLVAIGILYSGCTKDEPEPTVPPDPTVPIVTTLDASKIDQTSASTGGNVTSDGGLEVTERGICWGTTNLPTTSDNKIVEGTGIGSFQVDIPGLLGGKTYYARAFATNKQGTAYGNEISFSTQTAIVLQISAGKEYSLVLKSDGSVWTWGSNESHQLGDGTNANKSIPILFGTGFIKIASTYTTTFALKADGTIWGCGSNPFQQLGVGGVNIASPKQVASGFSDIAAGTFHVLALKSDGTLWAWGRNADGQLGDGTNVDRSTPVLIGSDFVSIAAGAIHSLALKSDGSLWAWGDNWYGKLGDGTSDDKNVPTLIGGTFSKISASLSHSLAIKEDGSLWVWGSNYYGELGDGTMQPKYVPTNIGTGYKSISAGMDFSLAIKSDGTLWAWGRNHYGQLGTGGVSPLLDFDNAYSQSDQPNPVLVGPDYKEVSAGDGHSLAIKNDLTLWIWGSNTHGQLGNGKIGNQYTTANPTQLNWE